MSDGNRWVRQVSKFFRFLAASAGAAIRLVLPAPRAADAGDWTARRDPLLVIFSQVAWWGVWQRPQEMARGLARRRRVLFVGPIQAHEVAGRYGHARRWVRAGGLTVFTPTIFSGEYKWPWVARLNRALLRRELRRALRGDAHVELLTNTPLAAPFLDVVPFRRVVYDVMDDFAAFDWAPAETAAWHERLLEAADIVFTGTYTLLERVQADPRTRDRSADFIACGVDFAAFHRPPAGPPPADIARLPRPILGFMGTLSERIDLRILDLLSRSFAGASIVLVGPVYRTLGALPQAANIHCLGLKPHDELPAYALEFDVALMPFRLEGAALAINPVKTLEYLAAGRPVVSTAIPDVVRFYSDAVRIASTPEEFVEQVAQALTRDNAVHQARGIEMAASASWETMVAAMERRLSGPEAGAEVGTPESRSLVGDETSAGRPLRIVLDARYLGRQAGGIATYSRELIEHLAALDPVNEYLCLVRDSFAGDLRVGANFRIVPRASAPLSLDTVLGLHRLLRHLRPDVFHSLFPVTPVLYRGAHVVTFHDLQPLQMREWTGRRPWPLGGFYRWFYRWMYGRAYRRADAVLAVSDATRRMLAEMDPKVPGEKTRVALEATPSDAADAPDPAVIEGLRRRHALPERYVLYIGSTRPNKNLARMFESFARARTLDPELREVGFVLALTRDRFRDETLQAIARHGLSEAVRIVESPDEEEKRALMHHADLLFFATRFEGFGLPVLEAQAQGTAVIAGNDGALPEIAGRSALLVDPLDTEVMARGLVRLLSDRHLRMKLAEKGQENVGRFSWETAAHRTLETYRSVV